MPHHAWRPQRRGAAWRACASGQGARHTEFFLAQSRGRRIQCLSLCTSPLRRGLLADLKRLDSHWRCCCTTTAAAAAARRPAARLRRLEAGPARLLGGRVRGTRRHCASLPERPGRRCCAQDTAAAPGDDAPTRRPRYTGRTARAIMPRRSIALGSRGQRKHGAPSQSPRPNPGPGTRRAPMSQLVARIAGLARDLGLLQRIRGAGRRAAAGWRAAAPQARGRAG